MAKAKQQSKETTQETPKKKVNFSDFYIGTGRRKTSVARVWLKKEKGPILINEKPVDEYFPKLPAQKSYEEPFKIVNRLGQFSGSIRVQGGGMNGQLGAVIHGISRALIAYDKELKGPLAKKKLLTRDPRMKERRKYGHAGKARKMKQSPKR